MIDSKIALKILVNGYEVLKKKAEKENKTVDELIEQLKREIG